MTRTAGLPMTDVWADRVLREHGVATVRAAGRPALLIVQMETLELCHHTPDRNYRPYLHLSGELRAIRPQTPLPFGITEVTYRHGDGDTVDAFYEFDDAQLVELTRKGYFTGPVILPEHLVGIDWELPATVDTLLVAPDAADPAAVIVFARVQDAAALPLDLENSGYDLTEYVPDPAGSHPTPAPDALARRLPVRSDPLIPLFGEEDYRLPEEAPRAAPAPTPAEPGADALEPALRQVEQEIAAERDAVRADREATAGTVENLYVARVARALTDADARDTAAGAGPAADRDAHARPPALTTPAHRVPDPAGSGPGAGLPGPGA
ncbi:hypothetical protein [Granulicoccus phenolivorans]|uniref:hypothetical protein n=1 Tax=Granulicoccus phenolivorans TaxID=266854 RepID=UPI000412CDB5|nr:hypothetical protein [Granulicoccus phenolivorans]